MVSIHVRASPNNIRSIKSVAKYPCLKRKPLPPGILQYLALPCEMNWQQTLELYVILIFLMAS